MTNRANIAVACPIAGERSSVAEWLTQSGYAPVPIHDLSRLDADLQANPIEALIADMSLVPREGDVAGLVRRLGCNRPLVVVGDARHLSSAVRTDVNVVPRPVTRELLLLSVALALAEGRPARRSPRRLIDPVAASAQGIAVTIREASAYGVGLELSGSRPNTLPPYFQLRIPSFGVHVVVKRAWMAPVTPNVMRCGGTIEGDLSDADRPWVEFAREAPAPVATLTLR